MHVDANKVVKHFKECVLFYVLSKVDPALGFKGSYSRPINVKTPYP